MRDMQLSRDFWLHEPPCWEKATPDDVARLQETVARVLQPARNVWGAIDITSWMWWSKGCVKRAKTHAKGGTVDFKPREADTREVFEWCATNLLPTGYIGRLIYEPEIRNAQGEKIQGEHIHMAPREDMIAHNGDGSIKALIETPDGQNYVYMDLDQGSYLDPYVLDPLVITAKRGPGLWLLLGIPAFAALLWRAGVLQAPSREGWA